MVEEWVLSFVQSLRWILAGMAGAAFSKFDLLSDKKSFMYKAGFLFPQSCYWPGWISSSGGSYCNHVPFFERLRLSRGDFLMLSLRTVEY